MKPNNFFLYAYILCTYLITAPHILHADQTGPDIDLDTAPEISVEEISELTAEMAQRAPRAPATRADAKHAAGQLKLLGILQVKNIKTKMVGDQFSIRATVDLFGLTAQVSLKSIKPLIFTVTLPKPISIPISPWKKIIITIL